MNKTNSLLLVIAVLFAASCTKNHEDVLLQNETIYFQYEYVNYAWSYQHHGFIIDQQGNIYDYDQPENWTWTEHNQISATDFESNLSQAEVRLSQLSGSDLTRMKVMALQAKQGELTEHKTVMADAGAEIYAIYMAQEGEQTLTKYLLQQRGDLYQKNKSSASDEITEWLIGIRGEEGFSDQPFESL